MTDMRRQQMQLREQMMELVPGLMGSLTCRVTWTNNQGQPREHVSKIIIRNKRYHHGRP